MKAHRTHLTVLAWVFLLVGALPAVGVRLTVQGTAGQTGAAVTCDVKADEATGITGADLTLTYPAAALTFAKVELGDLTKNFLVAQDTQPGVIRVSIAGPKTTAAAGSVLRLTFTVNAGATGESPITLIKYDVFDAGFAKAEVEKTDGAVTFAGGDGGDDGGDDGDDGDVIDPNVIDIDDWDDTDDGDDDWAVDTDDWTEEDWLNYLGEDDDGSSASAPGGLCAGPMVPLMVAFLAGGFFLIGPGTGRRGRRLWIFGFLVLGGLASVAWAGTPATGDANGDGLLNAADAAYVYSLADGAVIGSRPASADADGDGYITQKDVQLILGWSTQGLGAVVPDSYKTLIPLEVMHTASGSIAATGGQVALEAGEKLTIPSSVLGTATTFTLSRCKPDPIDNLGNKLCYEVAPDPSVYKGATLTIPFGTVGADGLDPYKLSDVKIIYYDPTTRMYEMKSVAFTATDGMVTIPLDSVRSSGGTTAKAAARVAKTTDAPWPSRIILADTLGSYISSTDPRILLSVPYYEQGSTGYCWSCATSMVVNSREVVTPVKPWGIANALDVSDDGHRSSWYNSSGGYAGLIKGRCGGDLERGCWGKGDSIALGLYIGSILMDDKLPVILFLQGEGHVVTVVGYEKGTQVLTLHDPGTRMYVQRTWQDIVSKWWGGTNYFTAVVRSSASKKKPLTISTLSASDSVTDNLGFYSPLENDKTLPKSVFRAGFAWRDETTKSTGFRSHNGSGPAVASIPNYYWLDLKFRVANASTDSTKGRVRWRLVKKDTTEVAFSGDREVSLPAGTVQTVSFPVQDLKAKALNGVYELQVSLDEEGPESSDTCDEFTIDMNFGTGFPLQVKRETRDDGTTVANLRWVKVPSPCDQYYVVKKTGPTDAWQTIGSRIDPNTVTFTDDKYDPNKDVYYGVIARQGNLVYTTSDVGKFEKPQPVAAHVLYRWASKKSPTTENGMATMNLADRQVFNVSGGSTGLAKGLCDAGIVVYSSKNNMNNDPNNSTLWTSAVWGADPPVDVLAASGVITQAGTNGPVGMAASGQLYFGGAKYVKNNATGKDEGIYGLWSCDRFGMNPTAQRLDLNGDGKNDDKDFGTFADLVVSKNGSVILFTTLSSTGIILGKTAAGSQTFTTLYKAPVLTNVSLSADGSTCAFMALSSTGSSCVMLMPTSGGAPVSLDAKTGLKIVPDRIGLSSDGTRACFFSVDAKNYYLILYEVGSGTWKKLLTGTDGVPGVIPVCTDIFFVDNDQTIVFVATDTTLSQAQQTRDIYTIRVDGTGLQNMTNTTDRDESVSQGVGGSTVIGTLFAN